MNAGKRGMNAGRCVHLLERLRSCKPSKLHFQIVALIAKTPRSSLSSSSRQVFDIRFREAGRGATVLKWGQYSATERSR